MNNFINSFDRSYCYFFFQYAYQNTVGNRNLIQLKISDKIEKQLPTPADIKSFL